jgi:hypothetical protein
MAKRVDASSLKSAMQKALAEFKAPENMRKLGQMAAGMIKLRTRLGYGVERDGADKELLKPLAPSTIEVRKGNLGFFRRDGQSKPIPYPRDKGMGPRLSSDTSPSKSNLMMTGQLLDSVQVTDVGYGTVNVGPMGPRSDGLTNEKVAEYVTEGGRPFNNLSKVEVKRVQDAVKKELRARIKRALTKR